jgi:uncharacterized OsmC-like protein
MSDHKTFSVHLELLENYVFKADFDEFGYILTDEPPPLGEGEGPNPARLIGTAVANCLCASLIFALGKKKQKLAGIKAEVAGKIDRKDDFWRIVSIDVVISADVEGIPQEILDKAIQQFEAFCIVTQSIRDGIPINVEVKNSHQETLHSSS